MVELTIKKGLFKKTYKKESPTVDDWFKSLDAEKMMNGKNLLQDQEAADKAVSMVADYLGIPEKDARLANLEDILKTYYKTQKEIVTALVAASQVWGKNVVTPEKK